MSHNNYGTIYYVHACHAYPRDSSKYALVRSTPSLESSSPPRPSSAYGFV